MRLEILGAGSGLDQTLELQDGAFRRREVDNAYGNVQSLWVSQCLPSASVFHSAASHHDACSRLTSDKLRSVLELLTARRL